MTCNIRGLSRKFGFRSGIENLGPYPGRCGLGPP